MARKPGRPKWIPTEQDLDLIEELSRKRRPLTNIADALGIAVCTLHERKNEYPEISARIKRGRVHLDDHWFDAMATILKEGPTHPKWNLVWAFYGNKFIRSDEELAEKKKEKEAQQTNITIDPEAKAKVKALIKRKTREIA